MILTLMDVVATKKGDRCSDVLMLHLSVVVLFFVEVDDFGVVVPF